MSAQATQGRTLTRKVGQRVQIEGGGFYGAARVVKVNPKRLIVAIEATGERVNSDPEFLSDLAEGAAAVTAEEAFQAARTATLFHPGTFVRVDGRAGVYTVVGDRSDLVSVALAGGDGGRGLRVPRGLVRPVSAAEVAAALTALGADRG